MSAKECKGFWANGKCTQVKLEPGKLRELGWSSSKKAAERREALKNYVLVGKNAKQRRERANLLIRRLNVLVNFRVNAEDGSKRAIVRNKMRHDMKFLQGFRDGLEIKRPQGSPRSSRRRKQE